MNTVTGDTTGTVKVSVLVYGYVAVINVGVGGVTQFQHILPAAAANKWKSQATIEGTCGIALATAIDGGTAPALFTGPA